MFFTETTKSAREVARQQRRRNYSQQGTTSNNKKDGDQMKTVRNKMSRGIAVVTKFA